MCPLFALICMCPGALFIRSAAFCCELAELWERENHARIDFFCRLFFFWWGGSCGVEESGFVKMAKKKSREKSADVSFLSSEGMFEVDVREGATRCNNTRHYFRLALPSALHSGNFLPGGNRDEAYQLGSHVGQFDSHMLGSQFSCGLLRSFTIFPGNF